jgi:glycosyltransferase involved in cell wall biosynthesis
VICTYNRYDVLPKAIHSLLRQWLDPGSLEIIVVDNSPDQENATRFGARFEHAPGLRYLWEPTPGLSHARNVGTEHARADVVAFMDDDAVAATHWAAQILRGFTAFTERAGIVGGRVRPRWVSARPAWLSDNLLGYLSILDRGEQMRALEPNEWLVGCNIAFDKRALLEAGGFSRALGRIGPATMLLSNDELEVADKIHRTGRLSIYCPDALVHHLIDPSRLTRAWFRRRVAWQAVSDFIKDPQRLAARAPDLTEHVWRALRADAQGPAGALFAATDDQCEFERNVALIYDLVVSMLGGGGEFGDAPRIESTESVASVP